MDKLVEWTNNHAEFYPSNKETKHPRAWQPTCKKELYACLDVLIYRACVENRVAVISYLIIGAYTKRLWAQLTCFITNLVISVIR
jgi:hypothetical protein